MIIFADKRVAGIPIYLNDELSEDVIELRHNDGDLIKSFKRIKTEPGVMLSENLIAAGEIVGYKGQDVRIVVRNIGVNI